MKNVCKKLFSLMLVAVMLISVLPMSAMAADGDVYGNVKLKDGTELATIHASTGSTLDAYWKYALELAGLDPDDYSVSKRWIRNATTGNSGNDGLGGDYVINEKTEMSVIVKHNPVTIYANISRDGGVSKKQFTYTHNAELTLDNSFLELAGVSGSGYDVSYLVNGEVMTGKTIVADRDIAVEVQMQLKDDGKDDDNTDETTAPANKSITYTIKDENGTLKAGSFEPSDGKGSTVKNIIAYQYNKKWYNTYDFVQYYMDGTTYKGEARMDDVIPAGKEVSIRLEKIDSDPTTPTTKPDDDVAQKTLTIQVAYDGKVYEETYDTYDINTKVEVVRGMITEAFDDYDRTEHNITEIEDIKSGKNYSLGDDVKMDIHKTIRFTLEDRNSSSNKFPGTVYLHIYLDGKVTKPHKTYNSDDYSGVRTLMSDDKITVKEIRDNFLSKYYSVINSSKGFEIDGLYWNTEFQKNFVDDTEKFTEIDLDELGLKDNEDVHISLMLTNAKAKSSSTADSSNPKTGDSIFGVAAVMTVSVTALAVLVLNKKRMVK